MVKACGRTPLVCWFWLLNLERVRVASRCAWATKDVSWLYGGGDAKRHHVTVFVFGRSAFCVGDLTAARLWLLEVPVF